MFFKTISLILLPPTLPGIPSSQRPTVATLTMESYRSPNLKLVRVLPFLGCPNISTSGQVLLDSNASKKKLCLKVSRVDIFTEIYLNGPITKPGLFNVKKNNTVTAGLLSSLYLQSGVSLHFVFTIFSGKGRLQQWSLWNYGWM